jgi:hypothetical protein
MRTSKLWTLALASILATGMAGASIAQADDDSPATTGIGDDNHPAAAPTPATDDADDDVRGDGLVPGSTDATGATAIGGTYSDTTATAHNTLMSTRATPLAFEIFDQQWCVGDGPSPVGCDVKVVPPGPDAFTMFGETWCLNDAPGRTCDVRVRGDGIMNDDLDDDEG